MQTVLGFLLDFKSNTGKAMKRLRDDISKTTSSWLKSHKSVRRSLSFLSREFHANRGMVKNWLKDLRNDTTSFADVIADVGDKFGGLAAVAADTLLRPGALLSAGMAVAFQSGKDLDRLMVGLRKEQRLTNAEMEAFKDITLANASALHAEISQVGGLVKSFNKAGIAGSELEASIRTAIEANRVFGTDTTELAAIMIGLQKRFHMTSKEVNNFMDTLLGASYKSTAELEDLVSNSQAYMEIISRKLPGHLQEGLDAATKIGAALGKEYKDAIGLLDKFFTSAKDRTSQEFFGFRRIAAEAGADVAEEFSKAMEENRFTDAFKAFQKGIKAIPDEMLQQMARIPEIGQVLGLNVESLRDLKLLKDGIMDDIEASAKLAKAQGDLQKQSKDNLTITQKFYELWADIKRALAPFGDILVKTMSKVLDLVLPIAKGIADFVQGLGSAGQATLLLAGAFLTVRAWAAPLIDIMKIVLRKILLVKDAVAATSAAMFDSATGTKVLGANITAVAAKTGVLAGMANMVTASFSGALAVVRTMLTSLATFAAPILVIVGAVWLLNKVLQKAFSVDLVWVFEKALTAVSWVFEKIADALSFIVKSLVYVATLGQIDLWKTNPTSKVSDSSKPIDLPNAAQVKPSTDQVSSPTAPESSDLLNNTVAAPENWRKNFGTDDMIAAQYEAAEMIVKALWPLANQQSATSRQYNQTPHRPIPDTSVSGSR